MIRRRTVASTISVALAAVAAAWAASARAGSVDLELVSGQKVQGTLNPWDEEETFLCDVVRGSKVKASVKAKGKAGAVPDLELLEDGFPVDGAESRLRGRGHALAPFVATSSGPHAVRVWGEPDLVGDYQLTVAWTPRKSWQDEDDSAERTESTFAAPAGATVTISLAAAPGSAFVPYLTELEDADGNVVDLSEDGARSGPHTMTTSGECTVRFDNDGDDDGRWRLKVTVKPRKLPRAAVDLRDAALGGAFAGNGVVFGRVVDDEAGGVVTAEDTGSPIDGSSVTVPPGAMGGPAVITIAEEQVYLVEDGIHPAGPAVKFGPSGQSFSPKAAVTIPFNPAAFPGGTDSMVVYLRNDATGELEPVPQDPPYEIGLDTVTFYTSHFSTAQATSTEPRPFEGEFVALTTEAYLDYDFGGSFGVGLYDFAVDSDGTVQLTGDTATLHWSIYRSVETTAFAMLESWPDSSTGFSFVDDDSSVWIDVGEEGYLELRRGRSADVLVSNTDEGAVLLLRRARGTATPAAVAGKWHLFELGCRADSNEPGRVGLDLQAGRGLVTLTSDGRVTYLQEAEVNSQVHLPDGAWERDTESGGKFQATFAIEDGDVVIDTGEDMLRLVPVVRGDVLVGRTVRPSAETGGDMAVTMHVAVRASTAASPADVEGLAFRAALSLLTQDRASPAQSSYDVGFDFLEVAHDGSGKRSFQGSGVSVTHDTDGVPMENYVEIPTANGSYAVLADGTYSEGTPVSDGALSRGRDLYVTTRFEGPLFEIGLGVPAAAPPEPR